MQSSKRHKALSSSKCVVDGAQLRSAVAALKLLTGTPSTDVTPTFCLDPNSALYLSDIKHLMDVTLNPTDQRSLATLCAQPGAWLILACTASAGTEMICVALPVQVSSQVVGSPLFPFGLFPAKVQPWLQHSSILVEFDLDAVTLQSTEDSLAQFKIGRGDEDQITDWRSTMFQSFVFIPNHVAGSVAMRLPVHAFSAALRSVSVIGDDITVTLLKSASGPSVMLKLSCKVGSGSMEAQAALRGVKSGQLYDLCGEVTIPPATIPVVPDSTSPIDAAMAAAVQAQADADATAASRQAAADGDPIVEFTVRSSLHTTLFGDKARLAESTEYMLMFHFAPALRIAMTSKTGMVCLYAMGLKSSDL